MSMFSRRHYKQIASVMATFKEQHPGSDYFYVSIYHKEIVDKLAQLFSSDNPNFDVNKFREACKELS